jgi:hypothetical protein
MFSFANHKKTVDVYPHIRLICDLTTPNLASMPAGRSEDRFNRTIPTLLCPWENDLPLVDECAICLTSDVADRGVRIVLTQPFRAETVAVGYWIGSDQMREPSFFLGEVRRNQPIGGGFWTVGVELTEFANTDHRDALADLRESASKLLSPVALQRYKSGKKPKSRRFN